MVARGAPCAPWLWPTVFTRTRCASVCAVVTPSPRRCDRTTRAASNADSSGPQSEDDPPSEPVPRHRPRRTVQAEHVQGVERPRAASRVRLVRPVAHGRIQQALELHRLPPSSEERRKGQGEVHPRLRVQAAHGARLDLPPRTLPGESAHAEVPVSPYRDGVRTTVAQKPDPWAWLRRLRRKFLVFWNPRYHCIVCGAPVSHKASRSSRWTGGQWHRTGWSCHREECKKYGAQLRWQ